MCWLLLIKILGSFLHQGCNYEVLGEPESVSANGSIMYYNLLADISRFRNDYES